MGLSQAAVLNLHSCPELQPHARGGRSVKVSFSRSIQRCPKKAHHRGRPSNTFTGSPYLKVDAQVRAPGLACCKKKTRKNPEMGARARPASPHAALPARTYTWWGSRGPASSAPSRHEVTCKGRVVRSGSGSPGPRGASAPGCCSDRSRFHGSSKGVLRAASSQPSPPPPQHRGPPPPPGARSPAAAPHGRAGAGRPEPGMAPMRGGFRAPGATTHSPSPGPLPGRGRARPSGRVQDTANSRETARRPARDFGSDGARERRASVKTA